MVVSSAKDCHVQLAQQLRTDFSGPPNQNFIWWLLALGVIGMVGYVRELRTFSRSFMALTIIAMVLAQQRNGNKGFFQSLQEAIASGPTPCSPASSSTATPSTSSTETPSVSDWLTDPSNVYKWLYSINPFKTSDASSGSSGGIDLGTVAQFAALA